MAKESTSQIKAAKVYSIRGQTVTTLVASSLPVWSLDTLVMLKDPWSNWRWNHWLTQMMLPKAAVTPCLPSRGLWSLTPEVSLVDSDSSTENLSFSMALRPIQKWLRTSFAKPFSIIIETTIVKVAMLSLNGMENFGLRPPDDLYINHAQVFLWQQAGTLNLEVV